MDRVVLIILALLSGSAGISILLSRFFSKKWVWYVPSMLGIIVITFISLKIYFEKMEGYVELGYNILILMVAIVIIGNLMTNFLIDRRRRVKGKMKCKDEE